MPRIDSVSGGGGLAAQLLAERKAKATLEGPKASDRARERASENAAFNRKAATADVAEKQKKVVAVSNADTTSSGPRKTDKSLPAASQQTAPAAPETVKKGSASAEAIVLASAAANDAPRGRGGETAPRRPMMPREDKAMIAKSSRAVARTTAQTAA